MKFLILGILQKKPTHGYGIKKSIFKSTCGVWNPTPGSIYPTLAELEKDGYIVVEESEISGRKVKIYSLSQTGKTYFEKMKDDLKGYISEVEKLEMNCDVNSSGLSRMELMSAIQALVNDELVKARPDIIQFYYLHGQGKLNKTDIETLKSSFRSLFKTMKAINSKYKE